MIDRPKEEFVSEPFPAVRAACIVRDFENSLLEKDIFTSFAGDSPQVRDIVAKLEKAQKAHIGRINDAVVKILKEAAETT